MGLTRYVSGEPKSKPLLHARLASTIDPLDALTMQPRSTMTDSDTFLQAQYVMITGDTAFSHDKVADLGALNHVDNRYGAHIKVVLISKAAAEGLDFKNIRQIHIMEPWYNLSRIEQIIGRGVRNLSHCALPFEERNVEIYMHTTSLDPDVAVLATTPAPGTEVAAEVAVEAPGTEAPGTEAPAMQKEVVGGAETTPPPSNLPIESVSEPDPEYVAAAADIEEAADTYIYRMAYRKSSKIGQVTRLIKTMAVDCVLNIAQTHFTADKLQQLVANQRMPIRISSNRGQEIVYQMGDKPYTDLCDYQSSCEFKCTNAGTQDIGAGATQDIDRTTYTQLHTHTNLHQIMDRIRKLFRESVYYHQVPLIRAINIQREYPIDHIYATLTYMIDNRNELLVDAWGRNGYLVNHGDVYLFQPIEITDETVSLLDRNVPVDYRRENVVLDVPATVIPLRTDVLGPDTTSGPTTGPIGGPKGGPSATEAVDHPIEIEEQLETLQVNVDRAMGRGEPAKQKDWYSYAAAVFDDDTWKRVHGWKDADLEQIIVDHAVESMMPMQRLTLVTQGAAAGYKPLQTYLDKRWIASTRPGDERHGWWMLTNDPKDPLQLFVSSSSSNIRVWSKAEPEDVYAFPIQIQPPKPSDLAKYVGFFSIFSGKQMVFKVRDMTNPRNKGARMDSAGKIRVLELINAVQDVVNYTNESTKDIHQAVICVMLEALMRRMVGGGTQKRAFLSPEEAILL